MISILLTLVCCDVAWGVASTTKLAAAVASSTVKTVFSPYTGARLNLARKITTSGISAGAFVAVQFGVAYSADVTGVGVMAGGPFYCAANSEVLALTGCMSQPEELSISTLIAAVQSAASNGQIDPLTNLARSQFSLYSGLLDFTVYQGVVFLLEQQLTGVGVASSNITTEYYIPSGHCVPTESWGNMCLETESPWINDCNYDGVGQFLNQFYANLNPKGPTPRSLNVTKIDLNQYMPSGYTAYDVSMDENIYAYIPPQCNKGNTTCSLHVAWHGCNQYFGNIGNVFMLHSGYVQWASTNNLVVLFPQAAESLVNPEGCFDWWGFVNSDYAFKASIQMTAVRNVAKALGAL